MDRLPGAESYLIDLNCRTSLRLCANNLDPLFTCTRFLELISADVEPRMRKRAGSQ